MNNLKSYIDDRLSDVTVSQELKRKIINQTYYEERERRKTLRKNNHTFIKILVPVLACIAIVVFITSTVPGKALASTIKDLFKPKEVTQKIEGTDDTIIASPSVDEPSSDYAGYVIYIDNETFVSTKANGVETISGIANPNAYMTITKKADCKYEDYIATLAAEKKDSILEPDLKLKNITKSKGISYSTGLNRDDIVTTVYCADDGRGGCIIIQFVHTIEATEGYGSRFSAMLDTFEIV